MGIHVTHKAHEHEVCAVFGRNKVAIMNLQLEYMKEVSIELLDGGLVGIPVPLMAFVITAASVPFYADL